MILPRYGLAYTNVPAVQFGYGLRTPNHTLGIVWRGGNGFACYTGSFKLVSFLLVRMKELKTLQKAAYIHTFIGVTWFSAPYLVILKLEFVPSSIYLLFTFTTKSTSCNATYCFRFLLLSLLTLYCHH